MSEPLGAEPHVVLGLDPDEWERRMIATLRGPDSDDITLDGVPVSLSPDFHSHPVLGIEGHLHDRGRHPHVHRPKVEWDSTPIPLAAP